MAEYIDRQTVLRCIKESRDGIDWGQSEDGDAFLHYSAALYRTVACKECVHTADVVQVETLKAEIYKLKCQQDCKNQDYYTGYMSALSTVEGILAEMGEE